MNSRPEFFQENCIVFMSWYCSMIFAYSSSVMSMCFVTESKRGVPVVYLVSLPHQGFGKMWRRPPWRRLSCKSCLEHSPFQKSCLEHSGGNIEIETHMKLHSYLISML